MRMTLLKDAMIGALRVSDGTATGGRLSDFDKDAIDALVVLELFLQVTVDRARAGHRDRQVVALCKTTVRGTRELAHTEIFAVGSFTADSDGVDVLKHLGGVVFGAAQVEDKGEFVLICACGAHVKWMGVG